MSLSADNLAATLEATLKDIHRSLFEQATERLQRRTFRLQTYAEMKERIAASTPAQSDADSVASTELSASEAGAATSGKVSVDINILTIHDSIYLFMFRRSCDLCK